MTDFIMDANVLMSILISGKASYRPILQHFHFIMPDFALVEVDKYKSVIFKKTKMQEDELRRWTHFIFSNITILPYYIFTTESLDKANKLLQNIDLKDTSYVALGMQLDLVLLTRDKPLLTGLKNRATVKSWLLKIF